MIIKAKKLDLISSFFNNLDSGQVPETEAMEIKPKCTDIDAESVHVTFVQGGVCLHVYIL